MPCGTWNLGRSAPLARLDVKQQPRDIDMNGVGRVGISAARVLQFAAHVRGESVGHYHAEPGFPAVDPRSPAVTCA